MTLIAGDFNATANSQDRSTESTTPADKIWRKTLKEMFVWDAWRLMNSHNEYTWQSKANPEICSRIDTILLDRTLAQRINSAKIIDNPK